MEVFRSQGDRLSPLFAEVVPQDAPNEQEAAANFMRGTVIHIQVTVNDEGVVELYTEGK